MPYTVEYERSKQSFYESLPERRSGAVNGSHDVHFAVHAPFSPHNEPIPKPSKILRMKSMIHNFHRGTTARRCTFLRQTSDHCHAFSALRDRLGALGAAVYRFAELH